MMNESEPSASGSPTGPNLGRILAETRKARGWTIRYAANQLRLPESTLAHLEAEEFAMLPSDVYVKGYLRNYARLLRLSPDDIVEAYRASAPNLGQGRSQNAGIPAPLDAGELVIRSQRHQGRSSEQSRERTDAASAGSWTLLGAALVIAAAYGLTWWWPENGISLDQLSAHVAELFSTTSNSNGSKAEALEPDDQDVTPVTLPLSQQTLEPQPAISPSAATNDGRDAPASSTSTDPSASDTRGQADQDTLVLSFRGDSWATVLDADGNRLMNQIGGKGSTRTLKGKAPFKLTIGRVSDVTITMNGETYTLPNAEKRATEKFSVPFSEQR